MNKKLLLRNTLIYFLLLLGAYLFYVVHIERFMMKDNEIESSSKVDFVYQQF
jgi:hypothetical protein